MSTSAKLFRVTLEVADLESVTDLCRDLLDIEGKRHPGARHYFDCGGVILAVLDISQGGMTPTPGPKSLYFAVDDLNVVHERASRLGVLAPYQVHGNPPARCLIAPGASAASTWSTPGAMTFASARTAPSTPENVKTQEQRPDRRSAIVERQTFVGRFLRWVYATTNRREVCHSVYLLRLLSISIWRAWSNPQPFCQLLARASQFDLTTNL
jgi:hypothetical protein